MMAAAADQPPAQMPSLRVSVLSGRRHAKSVCSAALGGVRRTLKSSAAAAAAYESTTAAAADQSQDHVPLPGVSAVGGGHRLSFAGVMTRGDGRL